ncbi:sterol desaturase family protein [bacterium SCSIO 12643]|nr:sterol desaturase family protein [bacterium SCSIO 12643]
MEAKYAKVLSLIFILLILLEVIWSWFKHKKNYNLKDTLSNFFIIVVGRLLKPVSLAWGMFLFQWVEPYKIFTIPKTGYTFLITFLIVELVYYWYHRLSHEIPVLWAIHHTHHSSMWFNLSAAGRLNWLGKFTSVLFYIPLVLLGFSPQFIVGSLAISLIYQFLLHTETIGKLGILEGIFFNTPSAHRVHHGSNPEYLDKNYGGMLIIWDRVFGTYIPEVEQVKYGVTTGFIGHNPFMIIFKPLLDYIKQLGKRTSHLSIWILVFVGIGVGACSQPEPEPTGISEAEAAEIVATSLAYNTYGMASSVYAVSHEIDSGVNCNEQWSDSGTAHYTSIYGHVTSEYTYDEDYAKICGDYEMVHYQVKASQTIDAVYFSSYQDVDAFFTVTGMEDSLTIEYYSGAYSYTGERFSKSSGQTLKVSYQMQFSDLQIDKSTYYITGGQSGFDIKVDSDISESYSGMVVFINDKEAQISFSNGNTYLLNLETGMISVL